MADRNVSNEIEGMSPQQVQRYLQTHNDLTQSEVQEILSHAERSATLVGDARTASAWSKTVDAATAYHEKVRGLNEQVDKLSDAVAGAIQAANETGQPIDFDRITSQLPKGIDPARRDQAAKDVVAKGTEKYKARRANELTSAGAPADAAGSQAQSEVANASSSLLGNTPRWILQEIGGPLSEVQKQRIVEYWNDYHGTNFSNFDKELAPILQFQSSKGAPQDVQDIVAGALANVEPEIAMSVSIPGKAPALLSVPQMQILRESYGLSNDQIAKVVRLTAMNSSGFDNIGQVEFQPMVALLAATGKLSTITKADEVAAEHSKVLNAGTTAPGSFFGKQLGKPAVKPAPTIAGKLIQDVKDPLLKVLTAQSAALGAGWMGAALAGEQKAKSIQKLQNDYQEGLKRFNSNPTLAFLYALDHGLAERISQSGGDPVKLSGADNATAMKFLVDGGLVAKGSTPFEQMGGKSGDMVLAQLGNYFKSYGPQDDPNAPGADAQRQMPDPVAVDQALTELWRATFMTEPSDQLKTAFQAELQRTLSITDPNQTIDVTARIQDFIRQQPLYKQLYKNRPGGLSDQEYQGLFKQGVSSILGNVPDQESVQAGMQSGSYQTSVLSAAGSGAAKTSSTFLERLAQAANTVSANT